MKFDNQNNVVLTTTPKKKHFIKQLCCIGAITFLALSAKFASAADGIPISILNGTSVQYSCDVLYAGEGGALSGSAVNPSGYARVFQVDLASANSGSVPMIPLYQPTPGASYGAEPFSTIALGPQGGKGGKITMYHWYGGLGVQQLVINKLEPSLMVKLQLQQI